MKSKRDQHNTFTNKVAYDPKGPPMGLVAKRTLKTSSGSQNTKFGEPKTASNSNNFTFPFPVRAVTSISNKAEKNP